MIFKKITVLVTDRRPSKREGVRAFGPSHRMVLPPPPQIWNNDLEFSLLRSCSMKKYNWSYTQFSQFNSDDSLLLVSGVFVGPRTSLSGEIAVISLGKTQREASWGGGGA